jgi:NTP pyrophosphatase (non-canonical NTP hydrolase)
MKEDNTTIDPTWMAKTGGFAKDMTLRDEFAGRAMQILKDSVWNFELLATEAYELADAMLKARAK